MTTTRIEPKLYRHTKRKEWGLGILAWEEPTRRRYQFQDGGMRTIKKGYYSMVVEASVSLDESRIVLAELTQDLDAEATRRRLAELNPDSSVFSLKQQIEVFHEIYPEGFADPKWAADRRADDIERPPKKHRAKVLADTAALLVDEQLPVDLQVFDRFCKILDRTDLVPKKKERDALKAAGESERLAILSAINDCLGTTSKTFVSDFDRLVVIVEAVVGAASWSTITAMLALCRPKSWVPIRPVSFRRQAKWMAPGLKHTSSANGAMYLRYLAMAKAVDRSLFRANLHAKDLVDVFDFMVLTTQPR